MACSRCAAACSVLFAQFVLRKCYAAQLCACDWFAGAQDPNTLRTICENIVIPNLKFREADEETFQDNYIDYIRSDVEAGALCARLV